MSTPQCVWDAKAALGEGPVWSEREQALYWVDILNHRLHRYAPQSSQPQRTWQFDQGISAVAERATHPGLITTTRHGFAYFDPATEKFEPVVECEADRPGNRFNDGKCDQQGRFWAGSMDFACRAPTGSLYRVSSSAGGSGGLRGLHYEAVDSGYPVTNGPAWSLDQRTMYHNDSVNGRVYAFDFDPATGAVSGKCLFLQFAPEEGSPDGMTTDAGGGLWIAHWGASKLTRHDGNGSVTATVNLPCSQITSCTFGGPDLRTLYITCAADGLSPSQLEQEPLAGGLFAVRMASPGLPANLFAG